MSVRTRTRSLARAAAPKYSPVSVCGYHIRESGATPTQEMAWAFCIARAYADEVIKRGVPVDEFAGRLSFNFQSALRQPVRAGGEFALAAAVGEDHEGAIPRGQAPGSMWMRMIAGGGGGGLTFEQPELNIVRGAYYALIAALSGAQTMALCCYDEAYTIPTRPLRKLAMTSAND